MEIALDGEKDLLSVIQHQPFYSSYSGSYGYGPAVIGIPRKRISEPLCRRHPGKECQKD